MARSHALPARAFARPHESLGADQRGGVSIEYLVLTAIGLFVAIGLGALGVAMVDAYGTSLRHLYANSP